MLSSLLRQIFARPARDQPQSPPASAQHGPLEQARTLTVERRFDAASAEIDRVLAVEPENVEALVLRASVLRKQGRLTEAKRVLEAALALDPKNVEGWLDLGTCYRLEDDPMWARFYLRFANALDRSNADVWNELGVLEISLSNFEQAEESLEHAVNRNPELAEAWNNLGMILGRRGDLLNARRHFLRAVFLKPEFYMAACNLGLASRDLERFEDAERELRHALELDPCPTAARLNLAGVLQDVGRLDETLAMLEAARAQAPQNADVLAALSALWLRRGDGARAAGCAEEALGFAPDYAEARLALGHAQLAAGDFGSGWENYEARMQGGLAGQRRFPVPPWVGEDLRGKRIFVYGEQGIGDEIMFASCIPDLIARGAHCVLDCNLRLRSLMRRSFPEVEVLEALSQPDSPEVLDVPVDVCSPIGSLPRYLRTSVAAFGGGQPFLRADPRRVEAWRARLRDLGPGLNVGLSWRGGLARTGRAMRSVALEALFPLLARPGLQWVNLQHDSKPEELEALEARPDLSIANWPEVHADLEETAALLCALDLVVTACSTVVHLAGALGRPTLVMTPHGAAWRYLLEGASMPWYGAVTLLRQGQVGRWDDVLAQLALRLDRATQERAQGAALPQGAQDAGGVA